MKIGIIIQRYGLDINGGAELHARQLAEKLNKKHDVSIITTKSKSYVIWDNDIKPDFEVINNIDVYRFESKKKNNKLFKKYFRRLRDFSKIPIYLRKYGFPKLANSNLFLLKKTFHKFLIHQGPNCPEMIEFLKKEEDNFDIFIFFTYSYYQTYLGISKVKNSLLIPTAHDDKIFFFPNYKLIFENTKFIMYNSKSEKKLVEKTYPDSKNTKSDIAGVGIEFTKYKTEDNYVNEDYFVYIGRIDSAKNTNELIEYFGNFNSKNKTQTKLILIGKNEDNLVIDDKNIIFTGFISEQEKNNWLYHSKALLIPSKMESLSMVTLEAMMMGKPVVANYYSEVLRDHIIDSKAGYVYKNFDEFNKILNKILHLNKKENIQIAKNGKKYVSENYQWDKILNKFEKAFEHIKSTKK